MRFVDFSTKCGVAVDTVSSTVLIAEPKVARQRWSHNRREARVRRGVSPCGPRFTDLDQGRSEVCYSTCHGSRHEYGERCTGATNQVALRAPVYIRVARLTVREKNQWV